MRRQQHAMYLRSVKDVVPVRLGRIENPLPPQERYLDETDYMNVSHTQAFPLFIHVNSWLW